MNMTAQKVDTGNVVLADAVFEDGLLTLAGADDIKAGTILARDSSTLKFVLFVKGGSTNENGIPKAVLTYDVSASAGGDVSVRPMVRGKVVKERLIIDADGDDSNVDAAVLDQLRNYGITSQVVDELNDLDNGVTS